MPKRGKRVNTPMGEGKVVDSVPLKGAVLVRLQNEEKKLVEFPVEDVEPWEELEALKRKAEQPCEKHGDGPCSCQKPDNQSKQKGNSK